MSKQPRAMSDEALHVFLGLFDGDFAAARAALDQYEQKQAQNTARSSRPKRQLSDEVVIRVEQLTKTYQIGRQRLDVLKGIDLEVHKGEFLALTGPSGSGKSTLLQLMGGLDKPSSGSIKVHDRDLTTMNDHQISDFRNRTIGFVFQFFYLQPFLRLDKNLEVADMPLRGKKTQRRARLAELVQAVGLEDRQKHFPRELSGGQMQRAAIARALFNNPAVILADEPTGNLDSENGRAIIELFEKIRDEFGTTIVIVTHDANIAARADREIRLTDGGIA